MTDAEKLAWARQTLPPGSSALRELAQWAWLYPGHPAEPGRAWLRCEHFISYQSAATRVGSAPALVHLLYWNRRDRGAVSEPACRVSFQPEAAADRLLVVWNMCWDSSIRVDGATPLGSTTPLFEVTTSQDRVPRRTGVTEDVRARPPSWQVEYGPYCGPLPVLVDSTRTPRGFIKVVPAPSVYVGSWRVMSIEISRLR